MIVSRPRGGREHLTYPTPIPGIQRIDMMKILGVSLSNTFSFNAHSLSTLLLDRQRSRYICAQSSPVHTVLRMPFGTSPALPHWPECCMHVNVNVKCVTDTILWQGHHDRVMQLDWRYTCGICQMMPLKVWPNTALGCNHQSICIPQLQPLCSAARYPMYYPEGMKARVGPVQWSKPYSILAPTQDSNPGGRIQNHKRWPLHYHCTRWGYADMCHRQRLQNFIFKLQTLWFLPSNSPLFEDMCGTADEVLFASVLSNEYHVLLTQLVPPPYQLRVASKKIPTQFSGSTNIHQLLCTLNNYKTHKTGEKQYICGICAGHAQMSIIQSDVEKSASNPRIRIFII